MAEAARVLNPPRRLLMGSGPSNPEPRVLQALGSPAIAPDDAEFGLLLDEVSALGRTVFRTEPGCTLALAGASRAGIEAAMASLIEPGERVLVGVYGHFGELLCTLAARHGAQVERVHAPWGTAVDPRQVVERVRAAPPKLVAIVHADTSTGILQPLAEIGQACRAAGSLFLVDAVLSLGGCAFEFDQWAVDLAVAGLQKCLGGPPGQALVTLSPHARASLDRRTRASDSAYLDLGSLVAAWSERAELESADLATPMLFAAGEALRLIVAEGLEARWQRHACASQALRAGLEAMGLELFATSEQRVPMITLVHVPPQMDEAAVRAQLLDQHGIEIMAAFGPLRGKVWRIGTMGTNAALPSVLSVLAGLEAVLATQGLNVPRGAAVDAAVTASRGSAHPTVVAQDC